MGARSMQNVTPLNAYRYFLLSAKNPDPNHIELANKSFLLWKSTWMKVFQTLNFDCSHLEDDYLRQNIIACITHNNNPIALHLYSVFHIQSLAAHSHSYFRQYPEEFFLKLSSNGVQTVMSMEYMTVHPDWRKSQTNIHIGSLLGGLAFEVAKFLQVDAAIAPARRDHKVHEIAYSFGAVPILENIVNHNVPCDLIAGFPGSLHPHKDLTIQKLIEDLWKKRVMGFSNKKELTAEQLAA